MKREAFNFRLSDPVHRRFFLAILYTLLVYTVEHFVSAQQGYLLFIIMGRQGVERIIGLATTAFTFLAFVLFTWLSFHLPQAGRFFWAGLISVATIVQYGYWKAFHRFISEIDLDTVLAAPMRMWNDAANIFFNLVALLPIVAYVICAILAGKQKTSRGWWLLLPIALILWGATLTLQSSGWLTNPGTSAFQFYQTVAKWALSSTRSSERQTVEVFQQNSPSNNLVLIIDESIRGDHLQINGYERNTTPYLNTLSENGYVHNWGIAVAGGTCSQISNSLLITGVQVTDDISTIKREISEYPTLYHYAHAAGYRTYYLDAQTDYLWNGLTFNDLPYIDHWLNTLEFGTDVWADMRAADYIRHILDTSTGNFMILNKRGVHFLYEHSYPPEATVWEPIPTDYLAEPELVKNPYDNGVRFNVDEFLKRLLPDPQRQLKQTVILYTSDHAQTLFENGATWLHCNFTRTEASVPLLIFGELPTQPDTSYPASHSNILPTLLDLMSIPPKQRQPNYSLSLLKASMNDHRNRCFVSGSMEIIHYDSAENCSAPLP